MKTTIEISDPLLKRAKSVARRQKRTLRDLVEAGLRSEIERALGPVTPFQIRDASVHGNGLRQELQGATFSDLLDASYGDSARPP